MLRFWAILVCMNTLQIEQLESRCLPSTLTVPFSTWAAYRVDVQPGQVLTAGERSGRQLIAASFDGADLIVNGQRFNADAGDDLILLVNGDRRTWRLDVESKD